ncbi:hypothetical protein B0T22DRAFT_80723 [Podospora appendiculata]|uniref:Uncharacterized protein n=1 Tax=Podospora appendiculata TaxID=314037 RepID=A0AAE0XJX8_9PEZI|nr:hypothetical protein B0T22DRAFT_80723 [Podospora appendiculata]
MLSRSWCCFGLPMMTVGGLGPGQPYNTHPAYMAPCMRLRGTDSERKEDSKCVCIGVYIWSYQDRSLPPRQGTPTQPDALHFLETRRPLTPSAGSARYAGAWRRGRVQGEPDRAREREMKREGHVRQDTKKSQARQGINRTCCDGMS